MRFARKYAIVPGAGSDSHVAQGLGSVKIRLRDFEGPQEFLESMREADIVRKHKNLVYVQALKFLQTSGGRGGRSLAGRDGAQGDRAAAPRREQELMHPQGARPAPKKRQGAVSSITDDEIREKYLERAIRELNDLGRDLAGLPGLPARKRDARTGLWPPPGRHLHAQARGDALRDRGGGRLLRAGRQRADEELQAAGDRSDRCLRHPLREVPADGSRRSPRRAASRGSPRRSRSSSPGWSW